MSCQLLVLCVSVTVFGFQGSKEKAPAAEKSSAAADNKAANEAQGADKSESKEKRKITTQEAFTEAGKYLRQNDLAGVVKTLEEALPDNQTDANLLLTLAQFSSKLASVDPQKPNFERHRKAAEYMRQGLKANPVLAGIPTLRSQAGPIYYNEACALAVDNQPEKALKSLDEAVEFGFKDLALMERDTDLKSVRELAGYAAFKTKAEETIRAAVEAARARMTKEVEDILAQNEPFDFNFELTDTDGQAIKLADFGGKVLIVDVWGTWCPPCRMEIPHFVALQKNFADAGLVIVGLNSERSGNPDEALKLVQDFRKQNEMNYRCALVNNDTLQQIPEFNAFPTTLFLDRGGEIRAKVIGYHDYEMLEILVRKLLDEKFDAAEAAAKKKTRLAFGVPGFIRRTPWPVPEQGGVQAHLWVTAFSPDGKSYLAFGDSGPRGILRLFDLATGKPLKDFSTNKDVWFVNAAFLPNGEQLVTAYTNDKNIYLWEVATGKLIRELQGHTADGVTVAVSHDGRRLASFGKDGSLRLWDASTGEQTWNQSVAGEEIARVVFSPDDRLLLTSGGDRSLHLRQANTGEVIATLGGHTATCVGDFSPDGKQLLSWAEDGQVRVWDVGKEKVLQSFTGKPGSARQAWFLAGSRELLIWSGDSEFTVYEAASGRKLRQIVVAEMVAPGWSEATVSADGQRLIVVNSDGADMRLIDLASGEELYRSKQGKLAKARGFSFSSDAKHAIAGSFRSGVYLVELPVAESSSQPPAGTAVSKP